MLNLIRPSLLLGAIAGLIFGIIALFSLIPFPLFQLTPCLSCFSFTFIGAGVVFYLKKNSFLGFLSPQDGAFIGALSGFSGFIAASVIYLPVVYIFSLFSAPMAKSSANLLNSMLVSGYSLIIIGMLVFFIALLSALFSAFSGLIAAYIYSKIENNPVIDEGVDIIIEQ